MQFSSRWPLLLAAGFVLCGKFECFHTQLFQQPCIPLGFELCTRPMSHRNSARQHKWDSLLPTQEDTDGRVTTAWSSSEL